VIWMRGMRRGHQGPCAGEQTIDKRKHTPHKGHAKPRPREKQRRVLPGFHVDIALWRPDRDGNKARGVHHHAFNNRLTAKRDGRG
jgi:hypothetical protein